MEESEVVELIYINMDAVGVNVMNIAAIVFAYLVCAYLVGKELTRNLAIGISFCFTIFIAPVLVGCFSRFSHIFSLAHYYKDNYPDGPLAQDFDVFLDGSVFAAAMLPVVIPWIGSLLYMHRYVRKGESA